MEFRRSQLTEDVNLQTVVVVVVQELMSKGTMVGRVFSYLHDVYISDAFKVEQSKIVTASPFSIPPLCTSGAQPPNVCHWYIVAELRSKTIFIEKF